MIKIFKFTEHQFEPIDSIENGCWVNVIKPDNNELEKLSIELNVPLDFLMDSLDIDERARIEKAGNTTLIILRIPVLNTDISRVPFITLPLGIIIINEIILTVCSLDINSLFDLSSRTRNGLPQSPVQLLMQCFANTALLYLKHLRAINRKSIEVEIELHKAMKNEQLLKLLDIEKSLVFFITSLRSNEFMMERLKRSDISKTNDIDNELLDDIIVDNKQALEMASIYSNILSGMMDAFASVISNNLNIVMKLLTSITIILMLPTLVASIYGMNVKLPFQDSPHAFLITIGISGSLSIIGVLIFMKRKWF